MLSQLPEGDLDSILQHTYSNSHCAAGLQSLVNIVCQHRLSPVKKAHAILIDKLMRFLFLLEVNLFLFTFTGQNVNNGATFMKAYMEQEKNRC